MSFKCSLLLSMPTQRPMYISVILWCDIRWQSTLTRVTSHYVYWSLTRLSRNTLSQRFQYLSYFNHIISCRPTTLIYIAYREVRYYVLISDQHTAPAAQAINIGLCNQLVVTSVFTFYCPHIFKLFYVALKLLKYMLLIFESTKTCSVYEFIQLFNCSLYNDVLLNIICRQFPTWTEHRKLGPSKKRPTKMSDSRK